MSTRKMTKIEYWTGVPQTAKPYVIATSPLTRKGAVLLCTKNPKTWLTQIQFWQKNLNAVEAGLKPVSAILESNADVLIKNYPVFSRLKDKEPMLVLAQTEILAQKFPSPKELESKSLRLTAGQTLNLPKLIGFLLSAHYQKERAAHSPGAFAKRGGIIDIFPLLKDHLIRLELFGNKLESIKIINNNKIIEQPNNVTIPPLKVANPTGTILDWLPSLVTIILDEPEPESKERLKKFPLIVFEAFPCAGPENVVRFSFQNPPLALGNLQTLNNTLQQFRKKKYQIFIASKKLPAIETGFEPVSAMITPFSLSAGFQNQKAKIIVFTDTEIFGFRKQKRRERRFQMDAEPLNALTPGMYIVHIDHGIGRFAGMVQKEIDHLVREYFCLEYAYSDKLFLPIDQADKITRYIGRENPVIHRLHGGIWYQIKKQVQVDAKKIAAELLKIQASRQTEKGFIFTPDTPRQSTLEASFPYSETQDQEKAICEVKADMESARPMDRLICGDVGFGKTEVAIRAAFKACENKKQVALLAPTTILAQQHFDTFKERLQSLNVRIGLLSRFQSKKRQKQTLKDLKRGKIDIVIGTHRLLSRDVYFFNLGLIIIDEEQRFGVRHKEKLKSLRPNLDILTLSATPIPRTLNFTLSGLRDISSIQTAPAGRKAIKTYVHIAENKLIRKAIRRELEREGQVYYLYNKVETILPFAKKIQKLVPEAKIDVAHGQMNERDLTRVMRQFDEGKIQILIATTIIENGLDLPNVNTLIVDNAPQFGLSQLYQIRGRIGRGIRQAYAYFFYHQEKLPAAASKRLEALLSMQELGSGFNIAMRDLEIRGSGNILGREQSGDVNSIGLYLYTKLLAQAIQEFKTGKVPEPILEVSIDLPLPARLPQPFIPAEKKRLSLYHQLSGINTFADLRCIKHKIEKTYGPLPKEVRNLFKILKIKILARAARIKAIDTIKVWGIDGKSRQRIILDFAEKMDWDKVDELLKHNPHWIIGENKIKIDFEDLGEKWVCELKESLKILKRQ